MRPVPGGSRDKRVRRLVVYGSRFLSAVLCGDQAAGTRLYRGSAVTPSAHVEVLDVKFVSPARWMSGQLGGVGGFGCSSVIPGVKCCPLI